jgi:alpha-galactosidase
MITTSLATWLDAYFEQRTSLPFSFTMGGQTSDHFITTWPCTTEESTDAGRRKKIFTLLDPESRLQLSCECTCWEPENAVEWILKLKNPGDVDTPVITNIRSLDAAIIEQPENACILHRALGSNAQRNDFQPMTDMLEDGKSIEFFPIGGRSSNTSVFPFFNIEEQGKGGIIAAIGWSGQWVATFRRDPEVVRMQAGLDVARLKLHPGEEIRTPSILLFAWNGEDRIQGYNAFRKFLLDRHVPKNLDGAPVILPIANSGRRGQVFGEEANKFTEENQLEMIEAIKNFGYDCIWIDAGWYVGGWPDGVGSWFPRPDGFPNGLRPIADAARDADMGFVLWFEPERVHDGSWLADNHPEWLLTIPRSNNHLLNLGNDGARQWLTDHVSGMISSEGITIYRQDFNIDPWGFWEKGDDAEGEDREGITEIRYIEGFYKLWDELLARHPGLVIDNCASGGRRIDLETISRSVALWRSDYQYFEPIGQQCMTYALGFYVAPTSTGTKFIDPYHFRSAMTCGLAMNIDPFLPEFDAEALAERIAEFKRIRLLYYGDFYPLTEYNVADDAWFAYQFHRDDMKMGMILAFRRDKAKNAALVVKPRGFTSKTVYSVEFIDDRIEKNMTGTELTKGITIKIAKAPCSALIVYTWE